jgi:hypothetical protein
MEDFLVDIAAYLGIINVGDRTIGSYVFKKDFLELLPKNFSNDEKEAFYQELKKKEFIISEKNITVVKYSGDLFNYKKEKEFFDYLDNKFKHDKEDTIEKIRKYYDQGRWLAWPSFGGKKHTKNNKKHKTQKRKTIKRKTPKKKNTEK